jgi:putative CocE/NonD family hydrolase
MSTSTITKTTISIERDVRVPMCDGVGLAADVWRAADAAEIAQPVLLQRTAYDKGELTVATHHAGLDPLRAIAAGFTVVIADVRGRLASGGDFSPFAQEPADGADAIAWVRDQPFCDGRVLTYGTSYNGALQLLGGGADALCAIESASPWHDGPTRIGGARSVGFLAAWAANDLAPPQLARRAAAGEDVAALAADLDARRRDPLRAARRLAAGDLGALGALVPALEGWLDDDPDAVASAPPPPAATPSLHIGGWHDLFLDATLAGFAAGGADARLVVGPWAHGVTGSRIGELDFGPDAAQDALDLTAVQLAFFDAVLAERLADIPRVRVFVMGANRWREEDAWPPARMAPARLHLVPGGALTAAAQHGDGFDAFVHDPADPVPTVGGAVVLDPALGAPGPADQRGVEARADVLSYTGAPLAADLELLGPVRATLHAATTSSTGTDWCVTLVDVHPDGRAIGICDGVVRVPAARARPGAVARHELLVGTTAIVVPAGHRLRVDVASSSFPRIDVHPAPARQRVLAGSSIDLPVTAGALA